MCKKGKTAAREHKNLLRQVPRHIVALDVLQSKNAVAQVILLSYHSLPLVKVT